MKGLVGQLQQRDHDRSAATLGLARGLPSGEADPHRSIAGMLRSVGGFSKDTSPFAESLWADFLRPHISRGQIRKALDVALREAQGLARSPLARYLPGWSGVMSPAPDAGKK